MIDGVIHDRLTRTIVSRNVSVLDGCLLKSASNSTLSRYRDSWTRRERLYSTVAFRDKAALPPRLDVTRSWPGNLKRNSRVSGVSTMSSNARARFRVACTVYFATRWSRAVLLCCISNNDARMSRCCRGSNLAFFERIIAEGGRSLWLVRRRCFVVS